MITQCSNSIWYGDKKGLTADAIMDFVLDGKFGVGNLPVAGDEDEEWFIVLGERERERERESWLNFFGGGNKSKAAGR